MDECKPLGRGDHAAAVAAAQVLSRKCVEVGRYHCLPLLHFSPQPEPFLSPKPPNASHQKMLTLN
jgi:hypothetical protein